MKRETIRHPKTHDLASRLGVDRPTALGFLTLLWDFVADSAIAGDVGKWTNGAIAGACDYRGEADAFIQALVDARWLDRSEGHRLIVHDWPDHCERWVKLKMGKIGVNFLPDYGSTKATTSGSIEHPIEASSSRDRTEPNQTKPTPTKPSADWLAVEEMLLAEGMGTAALACQNLRDARCTPQFVKDVIAYWRLKKPAWGAGALRDRLDVLKPNQDYTLLWPEPSEESRRMESAAKRKYHKAGKPATEEGMAAAAAVFAATPKTDVAEGSLCPIKAEEESL